MLAPFPSFIPRRGGSQGTVVKLNPSTCSGLRAGVRLGHWDLCVRLVRRACAVRGSHGVPWLSKSCPCVSRAYLGRLLDGCLRQRIAVRSAALVHASAEVVEKLQKFFLIVAEFIPHAAGKLKGQATLSVDGDFRFDPLAKVAVVERDNFHSHGSECRWVA